MMIEWASGDVANLFKLYEVQMEKASPRMRQAFTSTSEDNAEKIRNMVSEVRCY
jgi:hypothetical protein